MPAAGTVETVFSLRTIETGILPPTINRDVPDPEIPLNVVPNKRRDHPVTTVLSDSFGLEGRTSV